MLINIRPDDEDIFAGDGEMAAAMRAFDWSRTPVGPVEGWPLSLRTAVRILLQCRLPMYMAWGRNFTQFYNDAYSSILGDKHPGAIGRAAPDTWSEIWPTIGPMWEQVWKGESIGFDDFKLTIERFGYPEDCYFNFSYSPVPDDAGNVAGVLVTFAETTKQVVIEQRQRFRLGLADRLRNLADPIDIMSAASELLGTYLNVARVGYGEIDPRDETVSVERDWTNGRIPSLAGETRPLNSFGPMIIDALRAGRLLRLQDIAADPRSAPYAEGYESIGTRSLLVVPLIKAGRFSAVFYLHEPKPRRWSDDDASLADDVAERTWEALERVRAEQALRDSEDHYRHTVELNPHVQWTAGPDGQLDRVSHRWSEWTGTSGLGGSWVDAIHPEDRARSMDTWFASITTGSNYDIEHRVRMRDGVYHWMHSRAYRRADSAGNIVKWYGTTQDINDTKLINEALSKREQEFRTLAEAMPNHAWMAHRDGKIFWFNQRVYEYTGAGSGELNTNEWIRVVHPDDVGSTMAAWSQSVAQGVQYENKFRLRRGDGEYRWYIARALPVHDESGNVTRWVGTNTDVHEQTVGTERLAQINVSLEEEVASRTADRDRMWRLSTDIMLVARFDATITAVNPAWSTVLGWSDRELLGKQFLDFVHPDDLERTLAEAGNLALGIRTLRFENRYRHKDGSWRWLSWIAVPDSEFIHAVARDVTAEKKQAEALLHAEQALRQAQKMEAVGQLTGGIAHDFNNLLAGMIGNLEVMQMRIGQGKTDGLDRYINGATAAADRAAALTHRLLAFSRQQTLDPKPTSLNRLAGSMADLIKRTVGPSIVTDMVLAETLWGTLCDQNQLENALLNLVINARDAMPDGGRLTIRTGNAEAPGMPVPMDIPPGAYVLLSVTDTGTGMTPEVAARVFDPFFTTKPLGQGTGLGLSMIYGFVTQSGGHIRITSQPGRGTTVSLYLPRHDSTEADDETREVVQPQPAPAALNVLVVDDEADLREVLVEMLREWGYAPLAAADAAEALSLMESSVDIDLLVTDVGLPGGMSGRHLADAARSLRPDLRVLLITGYAENSTVRNGELAPGMEVMTKPFAMEAFANKLRSMTDGLHREIRRRA
jgi:PAS domain S-box-containing protein